MPKPFPDCPYGGATPKGMLGFVQFKQTLEIHCRVSWTIKTFCGINLYNRGSGEITTTRWPFPGPEEDKAEICSACCAELIKRKLQEKPVS